MTVADELKGLALLQQEVPENLVGHLPRVTCRGCKDNRCDNQSHRKVRCPKCGGFLTTAHIDLDYVGHAETTAQLLKADPGWTWEPLAFGADGLPRFDDLGGLWIRLTVCGVTRLGYGTADNGGFKAKGDVRKEIIGDALRNAAMRFGWALNLWAKTDIHDRAPQDETPERANGAPKDDPWATEPAAQQPHDGPPKANAGLLKAVNTALTNHGITAKPDRWAKLSGLTGREIGSSAELTVQEARRVLAELAQPRPPSGPPEGWTHEMGDQLVADLLAALLGARSEKELVEIGGQIAAAVKAGKITGADRDTLSAGYKDAQARGRKGATPQPVGASS